MRLFTYHMDFWGNLFILLFNNIPLDEGNILSSPCIAFPSSGILDHCRLISIRFWKGCTWASTFLRKRLRMVLTNVLTFHLLYSSLYFCCILANLIFAYLTMFFWDFTENVSITFTLPPYTSRYAPLFLLVQHCVLFSPPMLIVVHICTWMWGLQQKHGALIRSYTYTLREKWSSLSNYQTIANSLD